VIRVVLDTNVVISALLKEESAPALILSLVLDGHIKLCMTQEIFAEYAGVLSREKFKGLDHASVKKILLSISRKSLLVSPSTKISVIKMDPEDNKFLECALEARADYLVTGNRRHFTMTHYDKTRIVGPGDFLYRIVKEIVD
jgi:uncharacterized protein